MRRRLFYVLRLWMLHEGLYGLHDLPHLRNVQVNVPGFQGMVRAFRFIQGKGKAPAAFPDGLRIRPGIRRAVEDDRVPAGELEGGLHRGEQDLAAAEPVAHGVGRADDGADALSDEKDISVFAPVHVLQEDFRLLERHMRALLHLFRVALDVGGETGVGNRKNFPAEALQQLPAVIEQRLVAGIADAGKKARDFFHGFLLGSAADAVSRTLPSCSTYPHCCRNK